MEKEVDLNLIEKKPLTERSNTLEKIETPQFVRDRILWKGGKQTIFPKRLCNEPFASALIKYYNSEYFYVEVQESSILSRYRQSVELYIKIMDSENFFATPDNIFTIFNTYLKELKLTPYREYRLYTCFRSPILKLSKVRVKSRRQRNIRLFHNIEFSDDERMAFSITNKNAPNKKPPEKGDSTSKLIANDLIEHLNIKEIEAQSLIESLRAFSAFFIKEWGGIRDSVYELSPQLLRTHLERGKLLKPSQEGFMSNNHCAGLPTESIKYFNTQICLDIAKSVDNPLFTESFVLEYLNAYSSNKNRCGIAKTVWNWEKKSSESNNYDWLKIIESKYGSRRDKKSGKLCLSNISYYKKLTNQIEYPNITPEFIGSLGGVFPVRKILGISISEQVCLSWLLSTDRHQPSNLRWMTVDDITITNNSISTIIDVKSLKKRASLVSGRSYDNFDSFLGNDAGESYKKNQLIFKAIKTYKEQLIRSELHGLTNKENGNLWLFTDIREGSNIKLKNLDSRAAQFSLAIKKNMEIAICAMKGSLSNKYVLSKCPEASLFLDQIANIFQAKPVIVEPDSGKKYISNSGIKTMGWYFISKTAVYLKTSFRYSSSDIKESKNSKAEVDDRESQLATQRDAALQFHKESTRSTVYADKLPAYLVEQNNFGARVGDEWVRLARELSIKKYKDSTIMSLADVRKLLGLQTTAEKEIDQLNELFGQINEEHDLLDELGIITKRDQKIVIIRHPIIITNIQNQIKVIDQQLNKLSYSNEKMMRKTVAKYMYLKMILKEKFTPSEINEAENLYGDVKFPVGDILI